MTLAVIRGTTDTRMMDQAGSLADHRTRHIKVALMNGKTHGCGNYLPFVMRLECSVRINCS